MTLDESKGTSKDTSPGKSGQSPSSQSGTPKGKFYTVAEISKIKSDSAAMANGRKAKVAEQERDTLKGELQTTQSRLDALEREGDESRLAEARGDPEKLSIYQRAEAIKKRERQADERDRDFTRREGQIKEDRAEIDKDKGVVSINVIAAKHGLEPEELESLGISDPEALERVAERLAKSKGGEVEEGEGEEEEGEGEFTPDPGETTGSVRPTQEAQRKMTDKQWFSQKEAGKIP